MAEHAAQDHVEAYEPRAAEEPGDTQHPACSAAADLAPEDLVRHDAAPLKVVEEGIGTMLAPVLQKACMDRLGAIAWFRTDWQRGGALTGYADWTDEDGTARPAVVKLPVPPCERHWLVSLQDAQDVAPVVYAHGDAVAGYDLAWIVMERLPYGPLGNRWGAAAFDLLVEAMGRFYGASVQVPIRGQRRDRDWNALCDKARQRVQDGSVQQAQRWKQALKAAARKLDKWVAGWNARPSDQWVHGDLHLANALTRQPPPQGPAILIDYALTRPGCWVEDAVYLEHLYWSARERLEGRKLCSMIARERRRHGLDAKEDWAPLAQIKRALLAMATPAMLYDTGNPAHVQAALEVLEAAV